MSAKETMNTKKEVCAECGRGKGWHDVWCSALWQGNRPLLPSSMIVVPDGPGVTMVRKLEEVE